MGGLAFEPADKGGVKPPLTPEAPGFSRGVAHRCVACCPNGREFRCSKCGLVYNKYSSILKNILKI